MDYPVTNDGRNKLDSRYQRRTRSRVRPILLIVSVALVLVFALTVGLQSAFANDPPTVNGLFYGDGDYQKYWLYAKSEYGSNLYVHIDTPIMYVALVVDRSVNDNVCAPRPTVEYPENSGVLHTTLYQTGDANLGIPETGWGNHRDCNRGTDSEFVAFGLECTSALGQVEAFSWQQGYAEKVDGVWLSDHTIRSGLGTPPDSGPGGSYTSSSSWVWNITNYEANSPNNPWDLYLGAGPSAPLGEWKSPYELPPPAGIQNEVVGLDGYPQFGTPLTGTIGWSSQYQWEWPQVYEWSVDLSAACGDNPVYVLTGASHHSPSKNGDENDDFPNGDPDPIMDLGDLPDSYSTVLTDIGPSHLYIFTNSVQLGPSWDPEKDGQPSGDATGDDANDLNDDEDGVFRSNEPWINGANVEVIFDVQGSVGALPADVGLWIDWDGSGNFSMNEFYKFTNWPVGITQTVQLVVPNAPTYTVGSPLAVRARIFDDETNAPGGSLGWEDFQGQSDNGEVEDYIWLFKPTAVTLQDFSAEASTGAYWQVAIGVIILTVVTFWVLRRRQLAKQTNQ